MEYARYAMDEIRLKSTLVLMITSLGCVCVWAQTPPPLSRPGDVIGKAVIGYQGW